MLAQSQKNTSTHSKQAGESRLDATKKTCCRGCVFFHRELVGIVDWEYNEQVSLGNFCVLSDIVAHEGELIIVSDGERDAAGICPRHEEIS